MKEIKICAIDGIIHLNTREFWSIQKDIRENAIEECIEIVRDSDFKMEAEQRMEQLKEQKNS